MKQIIENIKSIVNQNGGELIVAMHGVTLETCSDVHDSNLVVTELTTKFGGKLYANSNWGVVNLEDTIADNDDWYTLEDIVKDTQRKFRIGSRVRVIEDTFKVLFQPEDLLTTIDFIQTDNNGKKLYRVSIKNMMYNFHEEDLELLSEMEELEIKLKDTLKEIENKIIDMVNKNGGLLITDIHYSGGSSLNTIVMTEDYINEEFEILAIKINEYGKLSILPFYEHCTRLSTNFEMDYDEDENQFDECLKEWLDIHKNWWVDLNGGDVNIGATLISMLENIETHIKNNSEK
jgi:hypothetical protein